LKGTLFVAKLSTIENLGTYWPNIRDRSRFDHRGTPMKKLSASFIELPQRYRDDRFLRQFSG
jgi:hypothetical protein